MTKPEKKVAIAEMVIETCGSQTEDGRRGYFIGDAVLDEVYIVRNSVGYFSCAKMVEEGDVLTKYRLQILSCQCDVGRGSTLEYDG